MENQTNEVVTPEIVPEVTSPEVTEPTIVATPEPSTEETIPEMSDEEVQALVDSLLAEEVKETPVVTEPQFFTKEKEEKVINEMALINELVTKQAEEQVKREEEEKKSAEAIKLLEEIQTVADEKQKEIDNINVLYTNIETVITPEIAKALAFNDTDNIPLHFIKENMDRVTNHPFVGPLVASLLAGNEVELLKIVKDAISKTKTLPNVATISNPEVVEQVVRENPMDSIVNSMIRQNTPQK